MIKLLVVLYGATKNIKRGPEISVGGPGLMLYSWMECCSYARKLHEQCWYNEKKTTPCIKDTEVGIAFLVEHLQACYLCLLYGDLYLLHDYLYLF